MKKIPSVILLALICSIANSENVEPVGVKAQGGTGFRINHIRSFEADDTTIYKEDGVPVTEIRAQGGTGYKVRYKVSETNPALTQGKIDEMNLINIYKGPIVTVSPLRIFNIDSLVTSETHLANGVDLGDLLVGDMVMASGFIDINSASIISRIEPVESLDKWKISGLVSDLSESQFKINNQPIEYIGAAISGCELSLNEGDFVEVFMDPVENFTAKDTLNTVSDVQCISRSVTSNMLLGNVIVEGMIDSIEQNGNFVISGQSVQVERNTRYIRGRAEDVQERVKLEVQGSLDDMNGVITADKVYFLESRINITVPVEPENITADQIQVAGILLNVTPQVIDPDGVLVNEIQNSMQLQFKGYGVDDLYITRVNERGQVDYNNVSLNGMLTASDSPVIEIFGLAIDSSTASFIGVDGNPLTMTEFFNEVEVGAELSVENASLDVSSDTVSGGIITIEEPFDESNERRPDTVSTVDGVGTITETTDMIYHGSFDRIK